MTPDGELGPPNEKLIVIVDDDENVRSLLEHIITKEGFRAVVSPDGEDGFNKISELMPDLVLLDLMLPKNGGFEVLRNLQQGPTAKIPVIIITGHYTNSSTSEMVRQEANVVDFLAKPIRAPILAMNLHKLLKTQPPSGKGVVG